MKIFMRNACTHRRQSGSAAVELALMIPILLSLLTIPLFVAIYCWHYSAAQRAAQSAARYMSTISVQEMRDNNLTLAAEATALEIARVQVEELNLAASAPRIGMVCNKRPCTGVGGRPLPPTIVVSVQMDMFDQIFGAVGTGRYGLPITVDVELPYVGN
jgi:hypothetical protein